MTDPYDIDFAERKRRWGSDKQNDELVEMDNRDSLKFNISCHFLGKQLHNMGGGTEQPI